MSKDMVIINAEKRWLQVARENAKAGNPPRDAVDTDPLQDDIERYFKDLFVQKRQPIMTDADAIADRLHNTRDSLAKVKHQVVGRADIEDLRQTLREHIEETHADTIKRMKEKRSAFSELESFKRDHSLSRPAQGRKKIWDAVAQVSIFLVLETLLNAWFYSSGVGLLAGAIVAFIFSCLIAALGFATGYLFRYHNAITPVQKSLGWAALLVLSFIAIYLSSVTATFRALSELARLNALQNPDTFTGVSVVPADTFARALILGPQIFTLHVPFNELNATLLFAMAIVAFVNATIAGYWFEDPVPGYSKASQYYNAAEAARNAAENGVRDKLRYEADGIRRERRRFIDAVNDAARLRGELALKYERCVHRTGELADKLSNDFKRAVAECRAENATVRAVPPPAYFAEDIPDPELDTDPAVFKNIRTGLGRLTDEHAELEPYVATLNAEIAKLSELRADLETTISDTFKAWQGEALLEWEAERRGNYTGKRDPEFVPTVKGEEDVDAESRTRAGV